MKASGGFLTIICACGLLAGCAGPTPQQRQAADDGREQVAQLLDQFSEAMREQDPNALRPLLSPAVREGEERHLVTVLGRSSWLTLHTGYRLQSDRALDRVSWREWQEPTLLLEIEGRNTYNAMFTDTFELARVEDTWYLTGFRTARARRGAPIDPPDSIRKAIAPQAAAVLAALAEGDTGTLLYTLLPDGTLSARKPKSSWWQRITGRAPRGPVPIYRDLEHLRNFSFSYWPHPEEDMELAFEPPNGVIAIYEVEYTWRGDDAEDAEVLRIELSFMPTANGWQFAHFNLSGEGIPFST